MMVGACTHTIICKTNKTTNVVGLYSAITIDTKQKREALTSLFVVPPDSNCEAVEPIHYSAGQMPEQ